MPNQILQGREVFLELQRVGALVRVVAMDTETMVEIVIQGPPGAGEAVLKQAALRRLEYVLRKKGIIA